jgi:hypothetical protein
MKSVAADLLSFDATPIEHPLPVDVAAGLAHLAAAPPLWRVDAAHWVDLIARVTAFAWRWDAPARAAGWTTLDLYGADRRAPGARVGSLGAAFLVARSAHSVLEVGRDAITVVTRAGSRLRIFRRAPDPDCAVAWDLCRTQPNPPIGGVAVPF